MSLYDYCCACTYLSENADYNGKYWCSTKGEDHYACDPKCYSFCEAYSRSRSAMENMYDNSRSHAGSGCYLTTIMCKILNYPDNNYYLNTLRNFRDNTMKTNIKYIPLLLTYDIVGPMIAYNLENDKDREQIAITFFNNYITKSVGAIEEEKYVTAINIYKAMTEELANRYNINMNIIYPEQKDINYETLGHGKIRKRNHNI